MAPAPIVPEIVDVAEPRKDTLGLPESTAARLKRANIDLSNGYPYRPSRPLFLDDVYKIRSKEWTHNDPGARADKEKKSLFSAASKVTDLTAYIGTEIEGLQLKDLTDQQKDELALLIAERSVVFFRDQDLSPQQQLSLGEWFGEVEVHVSFLMQNNPLNSEPKLVTPLSSPKSLKSPASRACPSSGPISWPQRGQPTSEIQAVRPAGTPTWFMSSSRPATRTCTSTLPLQWAVTPSGPAGTPPMRSCPLTSARSSTASRRSTSRLIRIWTGSIRRKDPSTLSESTPW